MTTISKNKDEQYEAQVNHEHSSKLYYYNGTPFLQNFGNTITIVFFKSAKIGYGNKKAKEIISFSCTNQCGALD